MFASTRGKRPALTILAISKNLTHKMILLIDRHIYALYAHIAHVHYRVFLTKMKQEGYMKRKMVFSVVLQDEGPLRTPWGHSL